MSALWWRVTVRCAVEQCDAVATSLVAATGQGVEEPSPGELFAVMESESAADNLLAGIVAQFPGASGAVTPLAAIDWGERWRDGIQTRRFGRLVVTPSWLPVEPDAESVVVTLDPESAFGTGEHGSTRVAMALLERQLCQGNRVLDCGSGSGILAIAAVKLGASAAVGIEVDDEAIPIAQANAERNGVGEQVSFLNGDAGDLGPLVGPADVICSNILRSVNTLLLPALRAALAPDGVVIFSGMEEAEAELFRPVLESQGWNIMDEQRDAGWWGVAAATA